MKTQMKANTPQDLTGMVVQFVDEGLENGSLEFPINIVCISANGNLFAIRYNGIGVEPTILATYECDSEGYHTPINLFFSSGGNLPLLARITPEASGWLQ